MSAGTVAAGLAGCSKQSVVQTLAQMCEREGKIPDSQAFVEAVFKREQSLSTAIGDGVAVPHAKVEGIPAACIAVGLCPGGIAWEAADAKPVRVVFLIASCLRDEGAQLKILAALARYVKTAGFVAQLEASQNAQDVLNVFQKFEEVVHL